jgi:phosphoglycolate phosphatase
LITLLFDLDGTLTDPRQGIVESIRHALLTMGVESPPDDRLERYIGPPLADTFAELLPDPSATSIGEAIAHYRERFGDRGWRENRVYPGVPDLLDASKARGWRCVLATSKPTVYAERIVRHFRLRPFLDAVYGSELDGRLGTKTELIAHIVRTEPLETQRSVMVGDRRHDVEGALANGIPTVGVSYGYGSREELDAAGARWLCDEPAAVIGTLETHFALET